MIILRLIQDLNPSFFRVWHNLFFLNWCFGTFIWNTSQDIKLSGNLKSLIHNVLINTYTTVSYSNIRSLVKLHDRYYSSLTALSQFCPNKRSNCDQCCDFSMKILNTPPSPILVFLKIWQWLQCLSPWVCFLWGQWFAWKHILHQFLAFPWHILLKVSKCLWENI